MAIINKYDAYMYLTIHNSSGDSTHTRKIEKILSSNSLREIRDKKYYPNIPLTREEKKELKDIVSKDKRENMDNPFSRKHCCISKR